MLLERREGSTGWWDATEGKETEGKGKKGTWSGMARSQGNRGNQMIERRGVTDKRREEERAVPFPVRRREEVACGLQPC